MILPTKHLEKLKSEHLHELAKFVVDENFNHHTNNVYPTNYKSEIDSIYKEEVAYFQRSSIFVSKDNSDFIVASIRVLRWDYQKVLPIQKIFGINPILLKSYNINNSIWHIGRFAVKKGTKDINLFKRLMVCAIAPICKDKNSIAFAECDSKLLKVMLALGIKATSIDKPINYLGSETIPVSMHYEDLIDFYNKNKSLVSTELLGLNIPASQLPKRVVLA